MVFQFNIKKTIAAVAYLIELDGAHLDMFLGLKMLYLADKESLIRWGKPITGDAFVSLPKGPVLTTVYDLFKGTAGFDVQATWDKFFSERVDHSIHIINPADIGLLSEGEREILAEARRQIMNFAPWDVPDWLHQTCPEWQDPHGHSLPIDAAAILRNAGRSDEEIQAIQEENDLHEYAVSLLGI